MLCFEELQALKGQSQRSADEIIRLRNEVIEAFEEADRRMRNSGMLEKWYEGCHEDVRKVCAGTNGKLFCDLLEKAKYKDADAVQMLRRGVMSVVVLVLKLHIIFPLRRSLSRQTFCKRHRNSD